MGMRQQHLVIHGRLPSIVLRFVIPDYLAGREILTFNFSVSGPRVVRPRTRRWSDLLVPGRCTPDPSQRYRQLYKYCDHSYTDCGHRASWAHASKSYLPKSYRGSFSFFCCSQFLHTHHLKPHDWVKQSIPFSYLAFTANSLDGASHTVQVYSDVSGGTCSHSPESVFVPQLGYRVELRGSNTKDRVELYVQCRCRLPPCHTPDTGSVHRDHRPSGMGYSILCHEGRA
jgi:hypothetical protein